MGAEHPRLLVVAAAAMGYEFVQRQSPGVIALPLAPLDPVFPAVTCAMQAALRTGRDATSNGMPGNGYLDRTLMKPCFWEQSAAQVEGPRIWDAFRARGGTVGMLFWQQSLGESADWILSPAPIHKHHGGMMEDCYSVPEGLYRDLCRRLGRPFRLRHYWGPMASVKSSDWIADATAEVMRMPAAPDLLLTYLPALDYDLQRDGPKNPRAGLSFAALGRQVDRLLKAAGDNGYEVLLAGDYAIGEVRQPVFPNRILREAGLMQCRTVAGRGYPDYFRSEAIALTDHEIAHVYVRDASCRVRVADRLRAVPGVAHVLDDPAKAAAGIAHSRAGDLVLLAEPGCWFAYPWWERRTQAPDYACHVDIHNKPGFDPGELFFGWPPGSVGASPARVRGSHGSIRQPACWGATFLAPEPRHLLDLAAQIREYLEA